MTVLGALLGTTAACASDLGGIPSLRGGWQLAFADDFDGLPGSLPAPTRWRLSTGHNYPGGPAYWGTGEVAYHTDDPANVSLDGQGNLRITPLRDRAGNWTSARIETHKQDFRPPPGGALRVQSRLRIPDVTGSAALGYWPAFWALGAPYRDGSAPYPNLGEFDFMESVNGADRVWGTLHCDTTPGGPCGGANGLGADRACPGDPCAGAFHTYRFDWDASIAPAELRWYVDGEQYHTVRESDLPVHTWEGFTGHAGYFLLLNLAIGGGFPDALAGRTTPTPATEPGHPLVVDYVAVWTRAS